MTTLAFDTTVNFRLDPFDASLADDAGTSSAASIYMPGDPNISIGTAVSLEYQAYIHPYAGHPGQFQTDNVGVFDLVNTVGYFIAPSTVLDYGTHTLRCVVAAGLVSIQLNGQWYDISGGAGSPRTSPPYTHAIASFAYHEVASAAVLPFTDLNPVAASADPQQSLGVLSNSSVINLKLTYISIATIGGSFWTNRVIAEEVV